MFIAPVLFFIIKKSDMEYIEGECILKKQNRKRDKKLIVRLMLFLCCVLAVISAVMVLRGILVSKKEQAAFEELAKFVESPPATQQGDGGAGDSQTGVPGEPSPELEEQSNPYAELAQVNPDFAAWLKIPQTEIDYPVMFTPDDPEYYLRRAFDKTNSQSGTPFIGVEASLDSTCFIIYGHNMNNGTMFGTLDYYTDPEFWASQRTFTLDTVDEQREYEVFAAAKTKILPADSPEFQYYRYAGDLDEPRFEEFIEGLQAQALYDTGILPTYGDQVLILSTCSYHTQDGRFIIAARKRN